MGRSHWLVDLNDPLAPAVVGAKAATLGRARRLGLPVLPGVVIPAELSARSLAAAAEAYAEGGSGAARLAVMNAPLDETLGGELVRRAAGLGPSLVVRSSSALESEGTWAGAFVSYVGIAPEQLDVAVRGCWASVYARDVLERCEQLEIDPARLRLAVLIQPFVDFEAGGAARIDGDGTVRVTATHGSPAALMTGWVAGEEIIVDPRNTVPDEGTRIFGADRLVAVADLARRVKALLGDDLIEWGSSPQFGVLLLQSRHTDARRARALSQVAPRPADSPEALAAIRLARLVRHFPGWLGEEAILPWAILAGDDAVPRDVAPLAIDPEAARDEARALARRLTATVWKLPESQAARAALQAIEAVRAGSAGDVLLERLRSGAQVDPNVTTRLVALLRAAERRGPPQRDRWEPYLYATLSAYGERHAATPVVGGTGAGLVRYAEIPGSAPIENDRKILIVPRPLPAFAPLLWNAAGLVSIAGGAGAHLMEIAHSLGVPSVMRCRLDEVVANPHRFLVAVDADEGYVAVLSR